MLQLKGGRGKKAPYRSTQVRCPDPVKPLVEGIIREFRETGEVPPSSKTHIQELQAKVAWLEKELADAESLALKYYRATQRKPEPPAEENAPKQGDRLLQTMREAASEYLRQSPKSTEQQADEVVEQIMQRMDESGLTVDQQLQVTARLTEIFWGQS